MMHNLAIRAAEDFIHAGYPVDSEAILLCEVDGIESDVREDCECVEALLRSAGATEVRLAKDEAERQRFWASRKNAFPAVGRISPDYYCMDGTIPRRELPGVLKGIAELSAESGLQAANVFHAGDGNMHPLILFDANEPGETERAEQIGARILELCVVVGGSITGEHGVGREKINQMCVQFNNEELRLSQALKAAFDPYGLLNPGKNIPTLRRCAEFGSMHVHRGKLPVPRTGALLMMQSELHSNDDSKRLIDEVSHAFVRRATLRIRGGDSKSHLGRPDNGAEIDTRFHRGVVSYAPTELVITTRAVTPLAELKAVLDAAGQMLPCEPPVYGAMTVGGAVATGLAGPRRPWTGSVRDFVLGCRVITGEAEHLRFGGEVMKNVAGYDMSRLLAGSYGYLGLITEVSLKILPKPRAQPSLTLEVDAGDALRELSAWPKAALPVSGACYLDGRLHVRLEGGTGSVAAAVDRIGGSDLDMSFWEALREQRLAFFNDRARFGDSRCRMLRRSRPVPHCLAPY
jgi:FAD/FMN-containing dehydrogenase